jgi:hypothetical protein
LLLSACVIAYEERGVKNFSPIALLPKWGLLSDESVEWLMVRRVGSAVCDSRRIGGFHENLNFFENFGSSFPEK